MPGGFYQEAANSRSDLMSVDRSRSTTGDLMIYMLSFPL